MATLTHLIGNPCLRYEQELGMDNCKYGVPRLSGVYLMNLVLILAVLLVRVVGFIAAYGLTGLVLYRVLRCVRCGILSVPYQMLTFAGLCILLYLMFLILIEILVVVLPSSFGAAALYILTHTTHSHVLLNNPLIRPTQAAKILKGLSVERAADTLKVMTVDRAAELLRAVDPDRRVALLKLLPDVRKWIIYERYYNIPLEKRRGMTLAEFEREAERHPDGYR